MSSNEALYPIREVSSLTGVNSITLRAWERRYGLIEPIRTDGGHRLYTLDHIDAIKAAVKLTSEGIPISQVKSRLGEAVANSKSRASVQGDYDYIARVQAAIESSDLESLSSELDQMFIDMSDTVLSVHICQLNKIFQKNGSQSHQILWQSQVVPRLNSRLRSLTRYMALHACKKIWVQSASKQGSEVALLIAATKMAEKGYYPMISHQPQSHLKTLFESLQALQCQGIAIVDNQSKFKEEDWLEWIEQHAGLEFHYFTPNAEDLSIAKKLHVLPYNI